MKLSNIKLDRTWALAQPMKTATRIVHFSALPHSSNAVSPVTPIFFYLITINNILEFYYQYLTRDDSSHGSTWVRKH